MKTYSKFFFFMCSLFLLGMMWTGCRDKCIVTVPEEFRVKNEHFGEALNDDSIELEWANAVNPDATGAYELRLLDAAGTVLFDGDVFTNSFVFSGFDIENINLPIKAELRSVCGDKSSEPAKLTIEPELPTCPVPEIEISNFSVDGDEVTIELAFSSDPNIVNAIEITVADSIGTILAETVLESLDESFIFMVANAALWPLTVEAVAQCGMMKSDTSVACIRYIVICDDEIARIGQTCNSACECSCVYIAFDDKLYSIYRRLEYCEGVKKIFYVGPGYNTPACN